MSDLFNKIRKTLKSNGFDRSHATDEYGFTIERANEQTGTVWKISC